MPISVICFICGHQSVFADKLAGRVMRCQRCGAILTVTGAAVSGTSGPGAPGETLAEAASAESRTANRNTGGESAPRPSRRGYGSPTRSQRAAGRNCIILSVLIFLESVGLGLLGVGAILQQRPLIPGIPAQFAEIFGPVMLGATFATLLMATVYLICGINIRRKGHASVIVALILTCLSELICMAALAGAIALHLDGRFAERPEVGYAVIGAAAVSVILMGVVMYSLLRALRDG